MPYVQLSIRQALQLIRSEYLEIPGLRLTDLQVARLWGLDAVTADALLAALVDARFLRKTRNGAYVRAHINDETRHVMTDHDRGYRVAAGPAAHRHQPVVVSRRSPYDGSSLQTGGGRSRRRMHRHA